jgi:membrane protease YdiL (CAAX protease family)
MMLGIASLGALFGLESCFGLVVWHQTTQPWALLLLTGLVEGLAFALSEELLFRGFLINLWVETSGWRWAIFWSALIFAISHFIRPIEALIASWPQFPGLLLMGFILGSARYWLKDRLGLGIGLHGSWIWGIYVLNVGGLVTYTGKIDPLWTGLNGNPLAGLLGLIFLGLIWGTVRLLTKTLAANA